MEQSGLAGMSFYSQALLGTPRWHCLERLRLTLQWFGHQTPERLWSGDGLRWHCPRMSPGGCDGHVRVSFPPWPGLSHLSLVVVRSCLTRSGFSVLLCPQDLLLPCPKAAHLPTLGSFSLLLSAIRLTFCSHRWLPVCYPNVSLTSGKEVLANSYGVL